MLWLIPLLLAVLSPLLTLPDCEVCATQPESEGSPFSFLVSFSSLNFSDDANSSRIHSFVRFAVERPHLEVKQTGMRIILKKEHSEEEQTFVGDGLMDWGRVGTLPAMGEVFVVLGSNPDLSDLHSDQLGWSTVRGSFNSNLTLNGSGSYRISLEGVTLPLSIEEVCLGFDGATCGMFGGNGPTHQRCFMHPGFEDGCELGQINGIPFIHTSEDIDPLFKDEPWVIEGDTLYFRGVRELYVILSERVSRVDISNVSSKTVVDLLRIHSQMQLTLSDTAESTIYGLDSLMDITALGNTDLRVITELWRHRSVIHARCASSFSLDMGDRRTRVSDTIEWNLRIGCPIKETESEHCWIRDHKGMQSKLVVIGSRDAWNNGRILVTGLRSGLSFGNGFYGTYLRAEPGEGCASESPFRNQCRLQYFRHGRYMSPDFCPIFVFDPFVPFTLYMLGLVFVIHHSSIAFRLNTDEQIRSERMVKHFVLNLVLQFLFALSFFASVRTYEAKFGLFNSVGSLLKHPFVPVPPLVGLAVTLSACTIHCRWIQCRLWADIHPAPNRRSLCSYSSITKVEWFTFIIQFVMGFSLLIIQLILPGQHQFWNNLVIGIMAGMLLVSLLVPLLYDAECCQICAGRIREKPSLPFLGWWLTVAVYVLIRQTDASRNIGATLMVCALLWAFSDSLATWVLIHEHAGRTSKWIPAWLPRLFTCAVGLSKLAGQLFDLISDLVVMSVWFIQGFHSLAFAELSFVLCPVVVAAWLEWAALDQAWQKVLLICGLGRIIELMDPSMDRAARMVLSDLDMHLESLPSLQFGVYVLLHSHGTPESPILFSMVTTWITVAVKGIGNVMPLEVPVQWKAALASVLIADFFVRCVSPMILCALVNSLSQGNTVERAYFSATSLLCFALWWLCLVLSHGAFFHLQLPDLVSADASWLRSVKCVTSIRTVTNSFLRLQIYSHGSSKAIIQSPRQFLLLTLPVCLLSLCSCTLTLFLGFFSDLSCACLVCCVLQSLLLLLLAVYGRHPFLTRRC